MKALLGLMQLGLVIGGIIAAFNGQWLLLIAGLVGAFVVGWLGARATRAVEGISESGRNAVGMLHQAERLIRDGNYRSAVGSARGALNGLRIGGDKDILPFAHSTLAVALAGSGDVEGARRALSDADVTAANVRLELREEVDDLRTLGLDLRRELDRRPYDFELFMAVYTKWNRA
jgi:archaellum component FlaG (FlaF/FlaG flagellin family)